MKYIRERKKELSTQKYTEHTKVGMAMIITEQDN